MHLGLNRLIRLSNRHTDNLHLNSINTKNLHHLIFSFFFVNIFSFFLNETEENS